MRMVKIKGRAIDRAVFINGERIFPHASQNIINHSPEGFAWGYLGSGPSQLALGILLHFYQPDQAVFNYANLKHDLIAGLTMMEDFEVEIDIDKYGK